MCTIPEKYDIIYKRVIFSKELKMKKSAFFCVQYLKSMVQ